MSRPLPAILLLTVFRLTAAIAGPPNVLLFISDDQRADAIGAFGHPDVKTPNLDRLVERGFSFRNAYCMGSDVGAVCRPSRAMLLSGHNLFRAPADLADVVTLPECFRDAGYDTFGTGKWHNGRESFVRSFTHGGAVFFGGMGDPYKLPVADYQAIAAKPLGETHPSGLHAETLFADEAIRFLRDEPHKHPFFAYVSFTSPHDPRNAPPEFAAMYDPREVDLPPNFLPEHPFDNGELKIRDEQLAAWPRTPKVIRQHLAEYYAMISHIDHEVGRVLEALEASGEAAETIVVFTSDHGLAIGSHGLMGKQNLYEHSMKAPLIVAGPRVPHRESEAFVYLFDLFPMLCDFAGIDPPKSIDGKNLAPIVRGEATEVRQSLFTAYRDVQRSIRAGRWKLIDYPRTNRVQLFDLSVDPHEMHDFSNNPNYEKHVEALRKGLAVDQRRYGDELTLPPQQGVER
ncbi:MAG: sulfatase-like hydrolase/transferase [Planctomycetaceae bacterium]